MNWRFSLRGLLGAITLAAVGCAALARPDERRTAIVVTASGAALVALAVRAVAWPGRSRLESCGGLLGAIGYLSLVFAPWFEGNVAPYLVTTRIIDRVEQAAQKYLPAAAGPVDAAHWGSPSGRISSSSRIAPTSARVGASNFRSWSTFHTLGQWLFAWIAGAAGAALMAGKAMEASAERSAT